MGRKCRVRDRVSVVAGTSVSEVELWAGAPKGGRWLVPWRRGEGQDVLGEGG